MLEVVVSGAVVEPPDVERYIRCTLLAAMNDYQVCGACVCVSSVGLLHGCWQVCCSLLQASSQCPPPHMPAGPPHPSTHSQKVADTTIAALRWLGAKEHPFIFWCGAAQAAAQLSTSLGACMLGGARARYLPLLTQWPPSGDHPSPGPSHPTLPQGRGIPHLPAHALWQGSAGLGPAA